MAQLCFALAQSENPTWPLALQKYQAVGLCIWGLGPHDGAPGSFKEKGDGRQPPLFFLELPLCSPFSGESLC